MKTPVIDNLRQERDAARDAAIQLAEQEDFDPGSEAFTELEARSAHLDSQIEQLGKLMEKRAAADALDGRLAKAQHRSEQRDVSAEEAHAEDWGSVFVRSQQYQDYSFRGSSQKVEVRALPHTLSDMADALPSAPIYDMTPAVQPNILLPLVTVISVSQNSVDYVVWNRVTGTAGSSAAAVVPEGTLKPSIEWAPTVSSKSLVTIAAHTSFSRQMAEDAQAIRSFLTTSLQNEVRRKVEEEAAAALAAATLPTVSGPADTGLLGAIRAGKAAVQANGFNPNGFLVASDDLVALDLEVMSTAGTAPNQTNSFWGMTPVVDPNGTAGEVVVGDFKQGVHHYSRNSVLLYLTDSHASNFTLNLLDAVSETRALTAVVRPDALVTATAGA